MKFDETTNLASFDKIQRFENFQPFILRNYLYAIEDRYDLQIVVHDFAIYQIRSESKDVCPRIVVLPI